MLHNKNLQFLFSKGILVSDSVSETVTEEAFSACFALARKFDIRITEGQQYANKELVRFAAEMLDEYVPLPFYRGFPQSVRELTEDQLLFDQLLHYTITYGFGDFSEPRYSVFEKKFQRLAFREETEPKSFVILTEEKAKAKLSQYVEDMLKGTRPLSDFQYDVVKACIGEGYEVQSCACKDTVIRLLFDLWDVRYAKFLSLSDVIKFTDRVNYELYQNENIKKLNLRNRDRKFIAKVIDTIFESGRCNIKECFEKKAIWCGLLHHIHYQPGCPEAEAFVQLMRGKKNESVYSEFERAMANGDIRTAVSCLREGKGSGALLRRLNYIVSRCKDEKDVAFVMNHLETKNAMVLLQLFFQYKNYKADTKRIFKFTRYNRMRIHNETPDEQERRQTVLSPEQVDMLLSAVRNRLKALLAGRLGKVYISPDMYKIALPIQENTANGGYGVLPKGSRLPIKKGKKIRAFTYWEMVDDIDLSAIGMTEDGTQKEFSWRTMWGEQSDEIVFSGDQTSGYQGGSEYFDIDVPAFKKKFPNIRYLIFCDNVYSYKTFDECVCKAGYMLRDVNDTGEIFEPKTVKSSFTVNCQSTFAYLFGIDLKTSEFVWLNASREGSVHVAGMTDMDFLTDYFNAVSIFNVGMLFEMLATEVVTSAEDADVVVTDESPELSENKEIVRSHDFEKILALLEQA